MKNNFAYFQNKECEYFPCHKKCGEFFNCLFCYCPLYALGDRCGGKFKYIEGGVKDCSDCLIPHSENGYSYVISRFSEISKLAEKKNGIDK